MHKRQLNPNEMCHMEMLDYFVTEMVRLARCAVDKAGVADEI